MRYAVALGVLICASVFLIGQQSTDKPEGKQQGHAQHQAGKESPAPASAEAAPKPSPEMERLNKWMVGTWQTSEKFAPMPEYGMPNGGTGKGISIVRLGPGGLSLVDDYRSRNVMGRFAGHGVTYWDPQEQAYKSFWIDSMSGKGETSTGKWEGNDLVFTGESEMQGKKFQTLGKMTNITPRSYTFSLANSAGGEMKEVLTIDYKKATAGGSPQTASKP